MNKRGAGVAFCAIAAFLFSVRYIAAAIYLSGVTSWDMEFFNTIVGYVGSVLLLLSVISLIAGICYLILAEKSKE